MAGVLRGLREAKGWSQKQLAEVSGISQQAIAHWELGDREPSASNLFALCRALGVSCETFAPKDAGEVVPPSPSRPRGRPKSTAGEEKPAKKGRRS